MNCSYHIENQVSLICIAPHNCQFSRKLCVEWQHEQGVDMQQHTVPIRKFQQMVTNKLQESSLKQTPELTTMLNSTQKIKQFWDDLAEYIKMIQTKETSYLEIMNKNLNPTQLSNTELEQLVQISTGKTLEDWNNEKNNYLKKLETTKNQLEIETQAFL
ncbi:unnamed protein product [Paramecium octaurelia]|uniref:Uncharacterized protein n=1 Tax=Paramecium octaurelia TaxID=43137 RepID=A0A8S1YLJ4_PAROT|nr:unnamed protein product [Paramecium octaurelia]